MNREKSDCLFKLASYCAKHGLLSGYDRKFLYDIAKYYRDGRDMTCRQKNHLSDLLSRLQNQIS